MNDLASRSWRSLRLVVLDRDLWLCQIRGPVCTHWASEVDHIIARADGGPMWDSANLRAACAACNRGRSAMRTNAARRFRYRTGVADYVTRF
jgi:5-methylcytosine-specific restriction endonuclease McrA